MKNTKRPGDKSTHFYRALGWLIILTTCLSAQDLDIPGGWARPLDLCWEHKTHTLTSNPLASDNESLIYFTETPSLITALSATTGTRLWRIEAGLEVSSPPFIVNTTVYAVSKFAGPNDQVASLRTARIATKTGIASSGTPIPFNYGSKFAAASGILAILSEKGLVDVFDFEGRAIEKDIALTEGPAVGLVAVGSDLYIWSGKGNLRRITVDRLGSLSYSRDLLLRGNPSGSFLGEEGRIYAGTVSGYVEALEMQGGNVAWRSRTGGAIERIEPIGQDLLVSSKDNFLYRLSREDGKRVWKRKLAGRIVGGIALDEEHYAFLSMGSNEITVVRMKDGKIINTQGVDGASYFVGPPVLSGGILVVPHDKGLSAFAAKSTCGKQ